MSETEIASSTAARVLCLIAYTLRGNQMKCVFCFRLGAGRTGDNAAGETKTDSGIVPKFREFFSCGSDFSGAF